MNEGLRGLKVKAAIDEQFYLRFVRDISMIEEEDGLLCHFDDLSNLRLFSVKIGVHHFHVKVPGLYPMKPPSLTLLSEKTTSIVGKTRAFHFDDKGRLVDEDLVGPGWRPMRGVHNLLKLMASELMTNGPVSAPIPSWISCRVLSDGNTCGAHVMESVIDGFKIAIVCDVFAARGGPLLEGNDSTAQAVVGQVTDHLSKHLLQDNVETCLSEAIVSAQFQKANVGASICVAAIAKDRVVCAYLGDVACHALQTSSRRSRQLTVIHDGFNEDEQARTKANIVKQGSTVRFFDGISRVSRCLGLSDCAFISSEPAVTTTSLAADDSIILVGTDALLQTIFPLEMSFLFCPLISAEVIARKRECSFLIFFFFFFFFFFSFRR